MNTIQDLGFAQPTNKSQLDKELREISHTIIQQMSELILRQQEIIEKLQVELTNLKSL